MPIWWKSSNPPSRCANEMTNGRTVVDAGHATAARNAVASPPMSSRQSAGVHAHHERSTCAQRDRKSTRLNSSHITISYAVFCLKKKKKKHNETLNQEKKEKHQNV